eukprot:Polyplicarium_translucidae@DN3161_c0_g1_i3.p1
MIWRRKRPFSRLSRFNKFGRAWRTKARSSLAPFGENIAVAEDPCFMSFQRTPEEMHFALSYTWPTALEDPVAAEVSVPVPVRGFDFASIRLAASVDPPTAPAEPPYRVPTCAVGLWDLNVPCPFWDMPLPSVWGRVPKPLPWGNSPAQCRFWRVLRRYSDVHCCAVGPDEVGAYRQTCMLHVADHLLRARRLVKNNNAKLKAALQDSTILDHTGDDTYRDQGVTRPRVLVLAPVRSAAVPLLEALLRYLNPTQIANHQKFKEEYESAERVSERPDTPFQLDWVRTFGTGNADDSFRLGIRLLPKSVQLMAPLDSSDVVLASPLGLRRLVGAEGDVKREHDFLSSIEVVVVDSADVIRMQNLEHLEQIMSLTSVLPSRWPDSCDIRRVRLPFAAEGGAAKMRQTIVLAAGRHPELVSLFERRCANSRGSVILSQKNTALLLDDARRSTPKCKHVFQFVPCPNHAEMDACMESFFLKHGAKIIGTLEKCLVVLPSHLEVLQMRKKLSQTLPSHEWLHEYCTPKQVKQARREFAFGDLAVLITTERWLYFRRVRLRGARHVVFFRPMAAAQLYPLLARANSRTLKMAVSYFSTFDFQALERLAGWEFAVDLVQRGEEHAPASRVCCCKSVESDV